MPLYKTLRYEKSFCFLAERFRIRHYKIIHFSTINSNLIVNLGGAQATDIVALIEETHRRVLEPSGIDLEVDVELRGDWIA